MISKELFKSINLIKLVLFLFFGISSLQSHAQCPPSFSYTTIDATDAFTNDAEITVTVNAPTIGPFEFALLDNNLN